MQDAQGNRYVDLILIRTYFPRHAKAAEVRLCPATGPATGLRHDAARPSERAWKSGIALRASSLMISWELTLPWMHNSEPNAST